MEILLIFCLLVVGMFLAYDTGKARAGDDSIVKFMNRLRRKNGK